VREPDPAQVAQLAADFPPQPGGTALRLVWEPGESRSVRGHPHPVERWFLYEMVPVHKGMDSIGLWNELNGPAPDSVTRYDAVLQRFTSGTYITQIQWDLYRATGMFGIPFWVIQGTTGGHPLTWSESMRQLCRLKGWPEDPPLAGVLEYAEYDTRVRDALRRHDRLRKAGGDLEAMQKQWRYFDREQARAVRAEMLKSLEDVVTLEMAMEMEGAASILDLDRPKAPEGWEADAERRRDAFLTTDED